MTPKSNATLRVIEGSAQRSIAEVRAGIERRLDDALRDLTEARAELERLADIAALATESDVPRLLFTAAEVAEMLGMGVSTVHDLRAKGVLVGRKIGASRRYAMDEIVAYVDSLSAGDD